MMYTMSSVIERKCRGPSGRGSHVWHRSSRVTVQGSWRCLLAQRDEARLLSLLRCHWTFVCRGWATLNYFLCILVGLQVATLWGSFEIKNVRLAKTLIKQYSGYILKMFVKQLSECRFLCLFDLEWILRDIWMSMMSGPTSSNSYHCILWDSMGLLILTLSLMYVHEHQNCF